MKRKREPVNACETAAAKETREDLRGTSRRGFLQGGVGLVAGAAAAQLLPSQAAAQQNAANAGLLGRLTSANSNGRPILLKDGIVLSMDPKVGDFEKADVLIQGKKIVSVGPNLAAPAQAVVVNADRMIVMPGSSTRTITSIWRRREASSPIR